jgi:outer membrane protein assembly factor BamB
MVYALDTTYGDLKWKSEVLDEKGKRHEKLWTSPVIQGNTLYISTYDGHIYSLSLETGELLDWSFESEAGFTSSPVIDEDTVFLGSFDRYLYAIKIGSDVPVWKFPQEKPAGNWFWASPIVNEGIVYAGCLDGKIYAIDAETGEKLWEFYAENPVVASPVLMDNLLIVTDESGTVYVFDLNAELENEAMPLKAIPIGADVRSAFCTQDGLVYIRGEDNQLYVVDIDMGGVSWKVNLTIEE